MAFNNRVVEFPNRYILRDEAGNETGPFYLIRDEGEVYEEGTPLNAENINNEMKDMLKSSLEPFEIDNNGNVSVRNIQRGKASIQGKANAVTTKEIKFPKAFDKVPTVVVSPSTSKPQSVHASAHSISTTGFTLHLYRKDKATNIVHWVAVL